MKPAITDITGIGPAAAEALAEHRITTVYQLSRASIEKISAVPGFSEARAARVIAAAAELHGAPTGSPAREDKTGQQKGKEKKAKKGKGKGKDKGKDKKKGKGKDKGKGKNKGKGKGKGKGKKNKKKGKK